jgi:hypothetical protein
VEEFYRVVRVFKSLSAGMQAVIKDITRQMGQGMAEFVSKDLGQGTTSHAEYDKYCHYVAGLVGEGLTRMFSESGMEDAEVGGPAVFDVEGPLVSPICMLWGTRGEWLVYPSMLFASDADVLRLSLVPPPAGQAPGPVQLHGAVLAEDQHHPRLPGGLRRRPRLLAAGGVSPYHRTHTHTTHTHTHTHTTTTTTTTPSCRRRCLRSLLTTRVHGAGAGLEEVLDHRVARGLRRGQEQVHTHTHTHTRGIAQPCWPCPTPLTRPSGLTDRLCFCVCMYGTGPRLWRA